MAVQEPSAALQLCRACFKASAALWCANMSMHVSIALQAQACTGLELHSCVQVVTMQYLYRLTIWRHHRIVAAMCGPAGMLKSSIRPFICSKCYFISHTQ